VQDRNDKPRLQHAPLRLSRKDGDCDLGANADFDGNIDQKSAHLRSVAGRIPVCAPTQDELFYLAHLKEFLEAYAKTANNEWPDFFVSRLAAVTDHFDRTIQQFPKWRDFVSNAEKDPRAKTRREI
jgi:hypothetical protein